MKRFAIGLAIGLLFAGCAQASSIVALDATDRPIGPSIAVIGATSASPSISGPIRPRRTSNEKVAAIGEDDDARRPVRFSPMVIRGGIVGAAFAGTAASAPAEEPHQPEAASPSSDMPELPAPR